MLRSRRFGCRQRGTFQEKNRLHHRHLAGVGTAANSRREPAVELLPWPGMSCETEFAVVSAANLISVMGGDLRNAALLAADTMAAA